MKFSIRNLPEVQETVKQIYRLINEHSNKSYLKPFDAYSVGQVYNYVRNLPYIADPSSVPIAGGEDVELLKSPFATIYTNGGDCDDKAILLGTLLKRKNIPFRLAIVSTSPSRDYHHIYPEVFLRGEWLPFDPTYPLWNKNHAPSYPFKTGKIFKKQVFYNGGGVSTLGFDITTIATIATNAINFFTSLFSGGHYTDAYHVWAESERQLGTLTNQANGGDTEAQWKLAGNRAIIAVLSLDYMNPISFGNGLTGGNVCTSAGRCGNRAEWDAIKTEVLNKAGQLTPFFLYLWEENKAGRRSVDFSLNGMVNDYNGFKNHSSAAFQAYQQQQQQQEENNNNITQAGFKNALPILLIVGAASYFLFSKKKFKV